VHAIRPAYIVLAGLGAGNLLLVVVAIVIICSYPLNRENKQGISAGGGGDGGYVGGGYTGVIDHSNNAGAVRYDALNEGAEHHEMTTKHHDVDEHEYHGGEGYEYPEQQPQQQQQQDYCNENEMNDRRLTQNSYDSEQAPTVEENPYFNNAEIQQSAAF